MRRYLPTLLALLLLFSITVRAEAQHLVELVDIGSGVYQPGDIVQLEVRFDFSSEPTLGGGLDMYWDPAIFSPVMWISNNVGHPDFSSDPTLSPGSAQGLTFGSFSNPLSTGTAGTLLLEVNNTAAPSLTIVDILEHPPLPFASAVTFNIYDPGSIAFVGSWAQITAPAVDSDGDGIADDDDNCIEIANTDQRDTDGDGIGNVCDPDLNNDCLVNFDDLAMLKAVFFSPDPDADFDGSGLVNFDDLAITKEFFFSPPGPSGPNVLCAAAVVNEDFGDGGQPDSGGWSVGSDGAVIADAGEMGPGDHALVYVANRPPGTNNGFNLLHPVNGATPNPQFQGDFTSAGITHLRFRARHTGTGDSVVLRVVLFDPFNDGVDWAQTTATVTVANTATTWKSYQLAIDASRLVAGGGGNPLAAILANVYQVSLRHDPAGSGPGIPSPVAAPTAVEFDDIALIAQP